MSNYYYVAIIPSVQGGYTVSIPGFPEGFTQGETIEEAIEMAEDVLSICVEEYTRERRTIPQPLPFDKVKENIIEEMKEHKEYIDFRRDVFYQLIKAPNMDTKPVKITVSFPKNVLEQIDKKADSLGLTRSKLLANGALEYQA